MVFVAPSLGFSALSKVSHTDFMIFQYKSKWPCPFRDNIPGRNQSNNVRNLSELAFVCLNSKKRLEESYFIEAAWDDVALKDKYTQHLF